MKILRKLAEYYFEDDSVSFTRKTMNTLSALVLAGTLASGVAGSIHKTGTTEVGVRTIKYSLSEKKGVEQRVYQPGSTYFFLPWINGWDTYDTRLANLDMSASEVEDGRKVKGDLAFKTKDGNDIHLDMLVSYRIDPQKAPYIREFIGKSDDAIKDKIVRTIARSKPRDIFGMLSSEEFYQAEKRNEAAEHAKTSLQEILEPYGIIIEKVAPKDYRFNPKYTQAITDKKLADAKEMEYRSQVNAQKEDNKRLIEEAKGTVSEMKATVNGQYQEAILEADAYYKKQENIANAIIAEGKAEAESIKAAREAMMSSGGSTLVKMKIAESLKGKKIRMIPGGGQTGNINLNTFDLNKYLEVRGLKSLKEKE